MNSFTLIGIAATVFTSTNIDDVFILLMFFSDERFRAAQVIAGQYLGIGLLIALSISGALVALVLPAAWIGLLGIFPLLIGILKLRKAWTDSTEEKEVGLTVRYSNAPIVAGVTFANGGDNLGVYIPLFANYTREAVAITVGVFLALVALWCGIALYLARHPYIGSHVKRYGAVCLPLALIGLGLWILSNSLPLVFALKGS